MRAVDSVDKGGREDVKGRIGQVRNYFGLTQEKFANRIGKTTGYISNVETGRCNMSDVVLQTISVIFKVVDCYVTDRLIAWLDGHPEVVMELKICSGLD